MTQDEIRQLRQKLGLTQEEFARRLGVSWNTIARWETGTRKPGKFAQIVLRQMMDAAEGKAKAA